MADSLTPRGPDDSGITRAEDSSWGLAHRRLAIIDPGHGQQPMSLDDELFITYNGECYNFAELRAELSERGHKFFTNCDTEVVLHLYREYGPECVRKMRGMFALAIWNKRKRELFLARDRLGQKPLYYALNKGRFVFGSEIKSILASRDFSRRVNLSVISNYLVLGYTGGLKTAFKNIQQLGPGHYLLIKNDNIGNLPPVKYWSVDEREKFSGTFSEAIEAVRETLRRSVKMRMISDVPLGAFLSGGIDSSIIVGLMSRECSRPVKTCSIGFLEQAYNELDFARCAAEKFGCEHFEHVVSPNCAETIETLAGIYDDPFADSSALPTWHLSKMTRQHVTVTLSGDGGDECFGGYDRYRAALMAERLRRLGLLRKLAGLGIWQKLPGINLHGRLTRLKRFLASANLEPDAAYLNWLGIFQLEQLRKLCLEDIYKGFACDWSELLRTGEDGAARAMRADLEAYLPGDLNVKVDRASMAHGLEVRCPFQDHELVELAFSLPRQYRINGKTGKIILRKAFGDMLPGKITDRGKRGFGVPVGSWFNHNLREILLDNILSQKALERNYFEQAALEKLWLEHKSGRADHGQRLWALLMLELWHRRYIDN